MDVTIENPDGNIFLGIEGKAEILTGSAEGVVLVPMRRSTRIRRAISCYLVKRRCDCAAERCNWNFQRYGC